MKIEELNQQPLILVMYHSGSSGEFFAHALSQSLNTVTHPEISWENHTRCKFGDFFGRSLNGGAEVINNDLVIERIKQFFRSAIKIKQYHIGLSHPYPTASIEFIKKYLPDIPIIEITVESNLSKKFKFYAANLKIPPETRRFIPKEFSEDLAWPSVYQSKRHLYVEWSDLILLDTKSSFEKIKNFLNIDGNSDKFLELINDYKERNADLLRYINEI
jgi:hypothetical protein